MKQASYFTDIQGHWAQGAIERLAEQGIIKGVGGDKFAPEQMLTHEQWYTLIERINRYGPLSDEGFRYLGESLSVDHWAYPAVNRLANAGFLAWFRLGEPVTRELAAETIARFLFLDVVRKDYIIEPGKENDGQVPEQRFSDVRFSELEPYDPVYTAVMAASDHGILKGFPDGTFRPRLFLTRAQAAVLLERLMNKQQELLQFSISGGDYEPLKNRISDALKEVVDTSYDAHDKLSYDELQERLKHLVTTSFLDQYVKYFHELNADGHDAAIMVPDGTKALAGHGIFLIFPVAENGANNLYRVFIREDWGDMHDFVSIQLYARVERERVLIMTEEDF